MNVIRKHETVVNAASEYQIGDQIKAGKYTATCQKVTEQGALFLLDQYLDKSYQMNSERTNEGGYEASELRKNLNADFAADPEFDGIRDALAPFENGDVVRIPTVGEFFGMDDFYEMDDAEQWPLMKDRRNRIAIREGETYEWGWLQNKVKESAAIFAIVSYSGDTNYGGASGSLGVRPVLLLVK